MAGLDWSEVAPGVWRASVGVPEGLTPLSVTGHQPLREALEALGSRPMPLDPTLVRAEAGRLRTVVSLPLGPDERLYGLGLQFLRLSQRGRTRYLRVNSDPRQDTGETHAPVPFYVSSRGYGVLANTARIVTACCGSTARRDTVDLGDLRDRNQDPDWSATPPSALVELVVQGAGFELLLFAGGTPLEAVRRYNLYCGGGALPPRWGLGFWHRVPTRFTADQALAEALEFRERGFPCDVIGLEPGWHSKSYPCTYEWAADRFPDPAGFIHAMGQQGFRVNLWEHPYVSPEAPIHEALRPLSGSHTVWGGLAPDLSLPEAREVLERQHEERHVSLGISGYKLDECDGSELTGSSWMFPAHAHFPSGHDGEQMRQVYGLYLQALTRGLFRKHDRRTYGLVRASNAGASSLPYVLYSDLYDHRQFVRALCNSSFSGLLWTPEARSADSAEEWVRRLQVVCFSPLAMLNAWSSGTKPWSFPEVESIVLKTLQLRMRLMPYLYSAFARYRFEGVPPFRAMALEQPAGGAPGVDPALSAEESWDSDDQYMAGDSLLVAPVFAGQERREVFLPPGAWYDFETGERFEGGRRVRVARGLERLPVFVRDGGIIPLMPALAHAPGPEERVPLEVRHYGTAPGRFRLYDDDGETYAYERGEYRWVQLQVEVDASGSPEGRVVPESAGPLSYDPITWTFMAAGGGDGSSALF